MPKLSDGDFLMPILTKEQIWEAIEELPASERAEFEQFLPPIELTLEQEEILRAEIAAHDRDPSSSLPWSQVREKLQRKLAQ